nr:hypothetical protein [Tanacetum cinerariifolium]
MVKQLNRKRNANQVAQNPRVQNVGTHNGLIGVQWNGIQNQIRNGNLVAARAEGNAAGQNANQIRCYNCRGIGIQLQAEEYDLMAAPANLDEIKEIRPNEKFIYNSIMSGPYVRRMIPEPGDPDREVPVIETFHEQTNNELTEKELKQVEADDQAIRTILLGLPEDIYAAVDSCETAQEIWESIESYYHRFSKLMNDFKRNKHFPEKISSNLKFLNNLQLEWSRHVTIVHQTKDLHTTYYTQLYDFLKYNQKERILSNPRNRQIAQPDLNLGQDRQMQMVGGNGGNQFRQYVVNQNGNPNGLIIVPVIANQNPNGNDNVIASRAKGNANGNNGIQLQAKEIDLMLVVGDLGEIEEVNENCIMMANL